MKARLVSSTSNEQGLGADPERGEGIGTSAHSTHSGTHSGNNTVADPSVSKDKPAGGPRALKMLFCFLGLQFSYVWWGIVQEQLMTKEYKLGKFKSSTFCVFGNRFLALIISFVIVAMKKFGSRTPVKEAPYHVYAPSSISNSVSSWAQYEALKFISFPTQVLSKSCKIIPVMLVGIFVNKKTYGLLEYLDALLITTGVAMFTFSEKSGTRASRGADEDTAYGIILLLSYLLCDSFTSQWQSRVFKQYGVDQYQMMFGVNIWSVFFTGISLLLSGEGTESMQFIMADLSALFDTVILSVTSAVGQLFIFYTVKEFGPVIFTIMMTLRQILSLFLSCLLFGHSIHIFGALGSCLVFLVVFNRIRRGERE
jgi:adenosine 3'-phospho 5'-phosphosulfate transporter B2